MKKFNEFAMIAGLLDREQDAREMYKTFKPEWLKTAELKPILMAINEYIEHEPNRRSPSLKSLHEFMEEKDKDKYNARWKATLEQLSGIDEKLKLKAIVDAKASACAYALNYLINENRFQQMMTDGNADGLKAELSTWLTNHTETQDEGMFTLQEAFDKLVKEYPWQGRPMKVTTGIRPIDEWSGGIRQGQLGILIAPTNNGKSVALMNIARHSAVIEGKRTLFITNEMSVDEQTERFMVRLQDPKLEGGKHTFVSLNAIQEDPTLGYKNLGSGYQRQLLDNLVIYSANLNQTAGQIDEICQRLRNIKGWYPEVIVIDYMERMATAEKYDKEKTWTFYGQLARELIWLGRRRRCVIWTAAQTNRAGLNKDVQLGLEHMQGSIQHAQEATLAYTMRRCQIETPDGREVTALEFCEQKSRFSAMTYRKMKVRAELDRMFISDEEVESIKEIEEEQEAAAKAAKKAGNAPPPSLNTKDSSTVWSGGKK